MQYLLLAALLVWTRAACRRIRRCPAVYRRQACQLGCLILLAMLVQEGVLFFSSWLDWSNGLPLHLCSLLGLLTLPMLLTRHPFLCSAALFIGVPGAALALIFPAVLATPWPRLTAVAFHTLHAGLVCAPWLAVAGAWRPRPRDAAWAGLFLGIAGMLALLVNPLTGGNYLFLAAPVAGTPLALLGRWGLQAYRTLLALLAFAVLAAEALLLKGIEKRSAR